MLCSVCGQSGFPSWDHFQQHHRRAHNVHILGGENKPKHIVTMPMYKPITPEKKREIVARVDARLARFLIGTHKGENR